MPKKVLFGVIYMSTAKLELLIVNLRTHNVIERVTSSNFVQNTDKSKIYQDNIEKIIFAITGFQQIMRDYGVSRYVFAGSQQLIDNITARYLSEQLFVRTGIKVQWLSTSQLNYYRAIALLGHPNSFANIKEDNIYVLYIGSAAATLSKFKNKEFMQAWNISLGYIEIDELENALRHSATDPAEIIDDYIRSKLHYLRDELEMESSDSALVLQDMDAMNNAYLPIGKHIETIHINEFNKAISETLNASAQYITNRFNIEDSHASRVVPGFLMSKQILKYTHANALYLTRLNVWDGIAIQIAANDGFLKQDFSRVILKSSENIATRYIGDEGHRKITAKFAMHIFDQLRKLHRMGKRDRMLLEVASNIADIGNAISQHEHYHHSSYIMEANPLIGLSDTENRIIAEVARYHSAEVPDVVQHHYSNLDPAIQMPVAKLVAILRLADALDDSHQQKVSRISISLRNEKVVITAFSSQDLALEKWAFKRKSELFYEVYGIKPELKQRRISE